jgi:hypothetical protein
VTKRNEIQISEAELAAMTADLDEMHHETFLRARTSRRGFLFGTGALAAGAVVLAACGNDDKNSSSATTTGGGKLTGDLQIAAMAASLENLAVGTYDAGIKAAQAGKLGTVPPAVVTFATTAMAQHKDHAAAWNAVLTKNGQRAVTVPDPAVKPSIDAEFAKVKDVPGLVKLALSLENVAAATYLNGISVITNKQALETAASIQPVEMQHAAILNFVLGNYPVPDDFAQTEGARPPSDYTG